MQRGWIVPVGGAEEKEGRAEILRKFVTIAGGEDARIAIIPTASQLETTGGRYERIFKELGARAATALPYKSRTDCERADWLDVLDKSTAIFLTGGNQLRISTVLGGTPVAKAIRRLNARGVHVGGTSAGAAILSEHMIAYGAEGASPRAGMATLAPGFGMTNRVVIDQHFRQRDRLGRLLTALAYNPFAVGLGLDEDTAAFIDPADGHTFLRASVIGLAVIWAEENSRGALFDAMRRREVYGTSGTRITARFFGGWRGLTLGLASRRCCSIHARNSS